MNLIEIMLNGLDQAEAKVHNDIDLVEIIVSQLFLGLIFGSAWAETHIDLNERPDPWLCNGNDAWLSRNPVSSGPDMRRFVYAHRITRLADAVSTLLFSKAVKHEEILRQRILHRPDTRAWFAETEIASLLTHNGCVVDIVKESGVRGQDFDLLVDVAGLKVSVEITSMDDAPLTVNTLLNKLHGKRNQVPKDRPAILYLYIPIAWMKNIALSRKVFDEAMQKFMAKSSRFNSVIFLFEEVLPLWGAAMPDLSLLPAYHNQPRHPIPDISPFTLKPNEKGEFRLSKSLVERLKVIRQKESDDARQSRHELGGM